MPSQWPIYANDVQGIGDCACSLHFNFVNDCYQRYSPTGLLEGRYCDFVNDPKCQGWDTKVQGFYMDLGATYGDDLTYPGMCAFGDCNNDGEVTISDLITLVNLSLDGTVTAAAAMDLIVGQDATDSSCLDGLDPQTGEVDINDIIRAVNVALDGPPPPPPPPPTPLPPDEQPLSQVELENPSLARSTSTPMETPTPEMETPTPDFCAPCMCADCEMEGCYDNNGDPCPVCDSCPPPTEPPTPEPTATPGKACDLTVFPTEINDYDSVEVTFDINPPIPQSPGGFIIEFYNGAFLALEDLEPTRPEGEGVTASASDQLNVICPIATDPVIAQIGARVYNASHTALLCSDAVNVAIYSNGDCNFAAAAPAQPGRPRVGGAFSKKTVRNRN